MEIINLMIIILLFEPLLQNLGFNYFDELLLLFLYGHMILKALRGYLRFSLNDTWMLICIVGYYFLGFLGVLIFDYQKDILGQCFSGIFSLKIFLAYFGMRMYLKDVRLEANKLRRFLNIIEALLCIVSIFLLIDQLFPIFPYTPGRATNFHSSLFIFTHSTDVASYAIISLLLATYIRRLLHMKAKWCRNYVPAIICVFASGRYKAVGFIVIYIIMPLLTKLVGKIKVWYVLLLVPFVYPIIKDQFLFYFANPNEARYALLFASIKIGLDHFPLGAGFGTFGTEYTRVHYSPLYYQYNISHIYGLQPHFAAFAIDSQWPAILGETGFIGLALIGLFFVLFLKEITKQIKRPYLYMVIFSTLLYLGIESVADSVFMSAKGVLIVVTITYMISLFHLYEDSTKLDTEIKH